MRPLGSQGLLPYCGQMFVYPESCLEEMLVAVEPWVSVKEVATHLGVTKDSVYRWINKKGLPARKLGRLWKCKISQVDAWVEAGGTATAPSNHGSSSRTGENQ